MAHDLTIWLRITAVDDDSLTTRWPDSVLTVTTAGDNKIAHQQTVGAGSTEALVLGDVASGGYLVMRNKHATDTIDLQDAAGNHFAALGPGMVMLLPTDASLTITLNNGGANPITVEYLGFDA